MPIAVEWLNQNSLRRYPFREDSGMRPNDSSGTVIEGDWSVPDYLVTDMLVTVSGSGTDPFLYLKRLSVGDGYVTLAFGGPTGEDAMSVSASLSSHSQNDCYSMTGIGSMSDARGTICLGDLERFFSETPQGLYSFSASETEVEPTCIRPSALAVRSITATDRTGYSSSALHGDISLVAGENISIVYDSSSNSITFSADPSSGYGSGCGCSGSYSGRVKSINGIRTENVSIVGDDCVSVATGDGKISISDKCSQPCCGCSEVSLINQTVNSLSSTVSTLEQTASNLSARLDTFVTNYLLGTRVIN